MRDFIFLKEIKRWQKKGLAPLSIKRIDPLSKKPKTIRYYLGRQYKNIYFTRREMEVAALLTENLTNQKTGKILGVSHRTVDCYVNSMRLKLGVMNKELLVKKLATLKSVQQFRTHLAR